ncbi:MAG: glycosyltransferase [Pseudobdellovibrio sp.]
MEDYNIFTKLTAFDGWMFFTVLISTCYILEDVVIDLISLFGRLKPTKLDKSELNKFKSIPQKKIAVMVANWKEDDIIEHAISGNVNNIDYTNYQFFLGVYPNDLPTLEAAKRLESKFANVKVVVNSIKGPTSKGQMLNEIVKHLIKIDQGFQALLIHDSEDVIHYQSLNLMNSLLDKYDYIQIPIFSLPVALSKFTAGIYIDEFVEAHTKDLIVRNFFNAGIPSAGVGTILKWESALKVIEKQKGQLFKEDTVTEDYHLGLVYNEMGFKCNFGCFSYEIKDQKTGKTTIEYIATREYFPQKIKQSVKQKSRWIAGISLQGFENLKWRSTGFMGSYFLWRDRKGLFGSFLFVSSFIFTVYFLVTWFTTGVWPWLEYQKLNPLFSNLMLLNLILAIFRILQRVYLVSKVYTFKTALFVPLRWIFSNFINTASGFSAIYNFSKSKVTGKSLAWTKTEHIVPVEFSHNMTSTKLVQSDSIGTVNSGRNSN